MQENERVLPDEKARECIIKQEREIFLERRYKAWFSVGVLYAAVFASACFLMIQKFGEVLHEKIPYGYGYNLFWGYTGKVVQIEDVASVEPMLGYTGYSDYDILEVIEEKVKQQVESNRQQEAYVAEVKKEVWKEVLPGFIGIHIGILVFFLAIGVVVYWSVRDRYQRVWNDVLEICYGQCIEKERRVYKAYRRYYVVIKSDSGWIFDKIKVPVAMYNMVSLQSRLIVARFRNDGGYPIGAYLLETE